MVCEQLGVVLGTPEPLEPVAGSTMLLGTCAPRDLTVSNVAQQHVLKRVLRVVGDCRAPFTPDEVLPLQQPQQLLSFGGFDAGRHRDATEPEHLAVHRRLLQQLFLGP